MKKKFLSFLFLAFLAGCAGLTVQDVNNLVDIYTDITNKPTPIPPPTPPPTPTPPPDPPPISTGVGQELVVWDGNTIAQHMNDAGFIGRDTAVWYALFQGYAGLPWNLEGADQEVLTLYAQRDEIVTWWNGEIDKIISQLRANPTWTAVVLKNDGYDKGGFRLGPPTLEKLTEFGDRISMGEIFKY